jgi:hypothetical protein
MPLRPSRGQTMELVALVLLRETKKNKELLFVRPRGGQFFELPSIRLIGREDHKEAAGRLLKTRLLVDYQNLRWTGATVGQPYGQLQIIRLYTADPTGKPIPNKRFEEIWWVSKTEAALKQAKFTERTQAFIFPELDKNGLW